MKGAIRYVVMVKAIVVRTVIAGKEWTTVDHVPIEEGSEKLKPKLGYTPEIERVVEQEVQLFEQRVDELDMAALVSVVNGLPRSGAPS
jgi:hypothetical protein